MSNITGAGSPARQSMNQMDELFAQAMTRLHSAALPVVISGAVPASMAVAYSGGLDSSVLLHLAHAYAQRHGIALHAFHVHHGLSPNADAWLAHCRQTCSALAIHFDVRHIDLSARDNIEEAARVGRYAALGAMCREHGAGLLLTAHHQDDQAETVLLQLLRGSGVAGMSGMDQANVAPDLLGDPTLVIARPLLAASREELEACAAEHHIAHIEDESNQDPRYARNALRLQVMPILAQCFPGYQERFSRAARHAQAAQRLLITLAQQDLAACLQGEYLSLPALRQLDPDRIDNVLRYWFGTRNLRMPSAAWLLELRTQLLEAKEDAQLCVTHPACHIRRYRERVFLTPRRAPPDEDLGPQPFVWNGAASMHFPAFGGTLHVEAASNGNGVTAEWLRQQTLTMVPRSGGEKLRLAFNRPAKSLKYHFQVLDVPAWERPYLPLVFVGEQLLYAAGIGMDCYASDNGEGRVVLRWQADLQ